LPAARKALVDVTNIPQLSHLTMGEAVPARLAGPGLFGAFVPNLEEAGEISWVTKRLTSRNAK
jgi:hypothetical protein